MSEAAATSEATADAAAVPSRALQWWRRPIALRTAFLVVVAGLLLTAVLLAISIGHYGDEIDARRGAADRAGIASGAPALRVARREVTALLTTGPAATSTPLIGGASPADRARLQQQALTLRRVLTQSGARATGRVAAAGVVSATARRVVVAVAATATVKDAAGRARDPRSYRFVLTLQLTGSHWLVSDLAVVV
jgi:hypothetical protein